MVFDSDVDQYKYYRTVTLKRTMPVVGGTMTLSYAHGLPYTPAFETFIKGARGTWGKVLRGAQSTGIASHVEFPYFGTEWVDGTNYNLTLQTSDATLPAHDMTVRLTLLYDEAFV